jgi:phage N-6-adenine-methyltransferase
MINSGLMSSNTDGWATPQNLFDELNEEFNFTLDVCASDWNHKCDKYFTINDDGLSQEWTGTCWMNPPYGREMIKWLEKAKYEADYFDVTTVCLIPARTNTSWWHKLCIKSTEIRFVLGRPKFGGAKHGLPFPLAIVIFSKNEGEYCKVATYNWRITYKY